METIIKFKHDHFLLPLMREFRKNREEGADSNIYGCLEGLDYDQVLTLVNGDLESTCGEIYRILSESSSSYNLL